MLLVAFIFSYNAGVENVGKVSNNVNSAVSPDLFKKLQGLINR